MPDLDSYALRIQTSEKFGRPSPRVLAEDWTLAEVERAHFVLDLGEDAAVLAERMNPPKGRRG